MHLRGLGTVLLIIPVIHLLSATVSAAPEADRIVVMISVDGLAGYYIDDPKAEMPNIRALASDGCRASLMKASTPTVTWPNHTTLVTGDQPARHGVVGNNYFDRDSKKIVTLISDPVFDKDQIVKVPTIYDVAKADGLKTAGIRWPASRNAKTLDWTTPDCSSVKISTTYTTPALLDECKAAGIDLYVPGATTKPDLVPESPDRDEVYTQTFNMILHSHRPNLALLHLVNVDYTEHLKGPQSADAYAAVKAADAQVGEVWNELKKDFPDKATLLIVSDHGFSPIHRAILANVMLRDAGLEEVKGLREVNGSVYVVTQGGAAMVYILDTANRDSIIDKVRKTFTDVEGVASVVTSDHFKDYGVADPKDDPHAPDMILFAKEGYNFGDTAGGVLSFNEKPEHSGSHGHDPNLPDLHATFVAWGTGIQTGANLGEIQNIDVAPTIAKLLHIDFPNTDGKPLDAALAK
jgi:predicted AlkP superfamily pyrophosphatase or phosphodiesterase